MNIIQAKKKYFQITIVKIAEHFQVSANCANYMYHRAYRSKYKGSKYLPWTVNLQNALIKADYAYGFNWSKLQFGLEEEVLSKFGIDIDTQFCASEQKNVDEWKTVSNRDLRNLLKRCGLII